MTIRQFDVVPNPTRSGRAQKPFLLCVQHRNFLHLRTRVMCSLIKGQSEEASRLNPGFIVAGIHVFLDPTELATIRAEHLPESVVSLEQERDRIIRALDLVITGV
jgi:toxin CcdB